MTSPLHEFTESLREFVRDYSGVHERAILRAPDVFGLFSRLFADERLDARSRQAVNGVLAYFVAPGDAMPEDTLGPYGLLDDLFVAAHAYRRLRRELSPDLLEDAWRAEGQIDEVMAIVYKEARAAVGKRSREALRLAGLV